MPSSRKYVEWCALGLTATLLVLGGRALARAHDGAPPPVVVNHLAPAPPDPDAWFTGDAQAHALTVQGGFAAWTEGDGSVRIASTTDAARVTVFPHEGPVEGPVFTSAHEVCWATSRSELRCGFDGSPKTALDVAQIPGSVVHMAADGDGVVWTQFNGEVWEAARHPGRVGTPRLLATLRGADDVLLDGDAAYVIALGPLRLARISRSTTMVTKWLEMVGPSHLGALLADQEALYFDTRDGRDGLTRILRVGKTDKALSTLYEGFAHVALVSMHGGTLYGVSAPFRSPGEPDLDGAVIVALPSSGGRLERVGQPAAIGWGGSVAVDDGFLYFTHGPINPVGAAGPIWRVKCR